MPKTKKIVKCIFCKALFHPWNGQVNAKYCSRLCACRDRNTNDHQKRAGKIGGLVTGNKMRGTGTKGYVKYFQRHEHRIVAEQLLGRKLRKGEIVHHKDGDKHNNSIGNLEVMNQSKHASIHFTEMWRVRKQKE